MARYPQSEKERRIDAGGLRQWVTRIFAGCGMAEEDATLLADSLVAADVRGIHSHGVLRVPDYVRKLRLEGVDPKGRPAVVKDSGAALVVDGGNSMGQIGCSFAMGRAIERARETGVAAVAVRGSNHCGAMFYYTLQAMRAGMIGIATTNALPTMAPWGGKDKIVGINPVSIAIPAGEEAPVVLDAAFSYSSHGKIRIFHQKGAEIPDTWAFDADGNPTTDAARALEGLLQPIGEFKGVGLAIVFGMLSSILSGAAYGTELGNMVDGPKAGQDGHLVIALHVEAFEDPARFRQRVDTAVREIRNSRRLDGVETLYAPGGLEADVEAEYMRNGIPLHEATWRGLEELYTLR